MLNHPQKKKKRISLKKGRGGTSGTGKRGKGFGKEKSRTRGGKSHCQWRIKSGQGIVAPEETFQSDRASLTSGKGLPKPLRIPNPMTLLKKGANKQEVTNHR